MYARLNYKKRTILNIPSPFFDMLMYMYAQRLSQNVKIGTESYIPGSEHGADYVINELMRYSTKSDLHDSCTYLST